MKLNLTPDIIMPCVYAFFASFGFSYVFNLRGKNMFYAALGGGLSWFVYLLFAGCFSSDVPQFFLSMVAVSLYSEYMARKHHSPVTVYLVIAYIPLVPGGGASLYNGTPGGRKYPACHGNRDPYSVCSGRHRHGHCTGVLADPDSDDLRAPPPGGSPGTGSPLTETCANKETAPPEILGELLCFSVDHCSSK